MKQESPELDVCHSLREQVRILGDNEVGFVFHQKAVGSKETQGRFRLLREGTHVKIGWLTVGQSASWWEQVRFPEFAVQKICWHWLDVYSIAVPDEVKLRVLGNCDGPPLHPMDVKGINMVALFPGKQPQPRTALVDDRRSELLIDIVCDIFRGGFWGKTITPGHLNGYQTFYIIVVANLRGTLEWWQRDVSRGCWQLRHLYFFRNV